MTRHRPLSSGASSFDACRAGFIAAFGAPGLALIASFIGFGALARELGLSLPLSLLSTVTIWAVPGQMALAEMQALGADFFAIVIAVTLINARFLPMALPLFVHLRGEARGFRRMAALYGLGQFIALTFWTSAMRVVPAMPVPQRLPWLYGFGVSCIGVSLFGTVLGYGAASALPTTLKLAFVLINPLFFLLVFSADVKGAGNIAAILAGAAIGLAVHPFWPDWSLIAGGVGGGTLAFFIGERFGGRPTPAEPESPEP
ncbi:MAG: AzlC family ABC transporter permease [Alphaproteobacteria bacterium]